MVFVNSSQCRHIGDVLNGLTVRSGFFQRDFLFIPEDRETRLRVYMFSAAICHQTHHLHHPAKNLWGWEYMEYGFLKMLKHNKALLNPGVVALCHCDEIKEQLQLAFSPDGTVASSTLDRIDERVSMLQEICKVVINKYHGKVAELIDEAQGHVINKGKGLYEVLGRYKAFSDPQKKKITFFIKLAMDAGVLHLNDPGLLLPIMDYHMQRVLLRMGCVEVKNEHLKEQLLRKDWMASDEVIRVACMEALQIIADRSGKGILEMNDYLWPLGRSCCNETTLCSDHRCAKSPCTFFEMIALDNHKHCAFDGVCKGAKDTVYRELWEPVVETNYY